MLPIANRPIVEHLLLEVKEAGIREFIFVVGYRDEQVREYFGNGEKWGVSINYSEQRKQLGTADAIRMAEGAVDGHFLVVNGDVIIGREEAPTSYHLAVVVVDALQGVTHVVRGQDLFWSTSVHRILQALLDRPAPVYHHHRLILDASGRKLSKSTQATGLRELRAQGATARDIRRMTGF